VNIVVVGAGLAGLTAADRLARHGMTVTVLEARDRVGGRTRGLQVAPGGWVDAGAAYLGDRHTELIALMRRLRVRAAPAGMVGDSRFELGDAGQTRPGRFPPLNAVAIGQLFDDLTELTRTLRVDAPWLTPEAHRLDTTTARQWAQQKVTHPDARLFFELFLGDMMAADSADISVLHMAFYLAAGGGMRYLTAVEGGAQQHRIDGGAHQLCARLAERLDVRLNSPVVAIDIEGDSVAVWTADDIWLADAVIVAVPPQLADRIEFRPALPVPRATTQTRSGCAVKVHLVYPEPTWRTEGLSGWSLNANGPLLSTVDDSPTSGGVGVLTGFVTGREAHRFGALCYRDQRDAVMAQAARLFPRLPVPISLHVIDWVNEPYSRGCYAALFGPGDWLRLGPQLRTPHGPVHWAGTETSTEFFGLMEGAIRSGHRAAQEILSARS
jgi:monoamine oxidase